ncbi:MAG TPA: ABC transporter ATP-binding protein [Candidatus Polarisedimenticolia bacterium]|jgi:ABC-2 type transport system ATP-binding protein|nr:ABC transporter ATP-binding protein [Candidatus Polarisedimenticolia bacterium]
MLSPIEITSLSKVFRSKKSLRQILGGPAAKPQETWALKDVSLQVPERAIYGLLGPNGAGKTTLLKILSCLVLPTSGQVRVGGFDTRKSEMEVKRTLGFVTSDERSFYWRLTGRENLQFFGNLHQLHGGALARRIDFLLEHLDLSDQADKPFREYSSGMKQRLAVARGLLHDPPVVLLDEPTRSLDPISAKHLRRFLSEELNGRQGKTLLLATHNLQEAEQLCQNVAVLSRGRILGAGRVEELTVWGLGKDAYVLVLSGMSKLPESCAGLSVTSLHDGLLRVAGDFSRDGKALSSLLGEVLQVGGRVMSCTRVEPTLQEVFDRIEEGRE